ASRIARMTERVDELFDAISVLTTDLLKSKEFDKLLEVAIAARLLFRALPGAEEQSRSALYGLEGALTLLIGKEKPVEPSAIKRACSFCGRQEPEVMLGAGPEAFICNECVDLFTEIFREQKEQGESRDG